NVYDLLDTSAIRMKKCIAEEWNKEFTPQDSEIFAETPEEKLEKKKEKLKRQREQITTENPWDTNSILQNGNN
ncbi:MAG: hypothetical protein ACM3MG_03250, partial [Bacillota bacterium]